MLTSNHIGSILSTSKRTNQYKNYSDKRVHTNWIKHSSNKHLLTTLEIIDHIIWNGSDCLKCSTLNHEARLRSLWLPLGADHLATGLGIGLQLIVLGFPELQLLSAP
jgi:hypothetical protein